MNQPLRAVWKICPWVELFTTPLQWASQYPLWKGKVDGMNAAIQNTRWQRRAFSVLLCALGLGGDLT